MDSHKKGSLLAFVQAFFWSMLPVLAIFAFQSVDAAFSVAAATSFGAVFFALVLSFQRRWSELGVREAYPYIRGNTFFNAFLYFGLVFWGTSLTSASNTAIILRMENLFSIVLLGGSGFDKISKRDVLGGLLMIIGAVIVLFPGKLELRQGDLIILIASALPVFGNVCSKKARRFVGSATIMFSRTILSAPVFWLIVYYHGSLPVETLRLTTIAALFINGFLVMGLAKMFWIEAIHLIPISTANSISSVAPLLTMIMAFLVLGEKPTAWQITAVLPMILGLNLLLTRSKEKGAENSRKP